MFIIKVSTIPAIKSIRESTYFHIMCVIGLKLHCIGAKKLWIAGFFLYLLWKDSLFVGMGKQRNRKHNGQNGNGRKKKNGRPTKYRAEFCKKLVGFFDVEPWELVELPHYQADGKTIKWMDCKRMSRRMPTLRGFAKTINVHVSNLYEWCNESSTAFRKEFRDAFTYAKEIRKEWLIDLGLSGLCPPLAYKFTAINVTDMIDRKDIAVTDETPQPATVAELKQALTEAKALETEANVIQIQVNQKAG